MRILTAIFLLNVAFSAFSQEKKIIDHTIYNDWKSLNNAQISNDGKYIAYQIDPHQGDGILCIYNTVSGKTDSIPRAERASFSGESNYIAFKITPGYDTLRTCELKKVKKTDWPKDSLGIYVFANDSLKKFPELENFEVNEENDWMAVSFKHNKLTEDPTNGKKKKKKKKKKNAAPEYPSDGKLLWLYHPVNKNAEVQNVTEFTMAAKGSNVAYVVHHKIDKIDSVHLNFFNTQSQVFGKDSNRYTNIQKMTFDHSENQFAFLATADTSKVKQFDIHLVRTDGSSNATINNALVGADSLHAVSRHFRPRFTMDDRLLYFGVGMREFEEPEDTLLEREKVKLDLWHYAEDRLQPQQLLELKSDQTASDLFVYHIANGSAVQIENDSLSVYPINNLKGNKLLASSDKNYAFSYNWVSPRPEDFFTVDIETGAIQTLLTNALFRPSLSPSGAHFAYFKEGNYYFANSETKESRCVTCDTTGIEWGSDMNGMPMEAYPSGGMFWNRDETILYLQSEYDMWSYNRETGDFQSFTHELGKLNNIQLQPIEWERDSVYFDQDNVYFKGFDKTTKGEHFYNLRDHEDHFDLEETAYFDAAVYQPVRSKNKERSFIRKMTFESYPEIYTYTDDLQNAQQISVTNPQQSEYNWGTVELTNWTSYDGIELEGLLYKPENFDSTKNYPLMVYFYELYSDRLHQYYSPKPTASIIFATEYASAGYVVFMPDIRYKPGHPAASAYDCIMSGTDHVLSVLPNVDSTRMALQGQSWGGYQTAQLVTMTTRYRAAMAGAPVANMFSAYGGIRWGSGLNRQFQYERTQSRIGYTIWERPDLYIENSPLFHLPNVTTPLMIMHNDGDGAVPWYQGIELFTGLKRLGKATWLLNYNDDDHNLMRNANRMDLSIRMRQFFDHYLLDAPAPLWLTEGIPATVKGKELRYE